MTTWASGKLVNVGGKTCGESAFPAKGTTLFGSVQWSETELTLRELAFKAEQRPAETDAARVYKRTK